MNILHMKYAVEVARTGSVNKAAESLLIAQPNLSRSIKELEADLGITIFDRSSKGMYLTPDGEVFIAYAQKILSQINDIEQMYKTGSQLKQRIAISVPRASYIADAFTEFTSTINDSSYEIFYKETNSDRTIRNILSGDYKLGIIRYAQNYEKYFDEMLNEKGLQQQLITDFHYVLLTNKESPLTGNQTVTLDELRSYIEIAHADPYVPSLSLAQVRKEELTDDIDRRIFVFERSSQFELLSANPMTYMWVSPVPEHILNRFGLVQIDCPENQRKYKDVLIYRKGYKMTELDNAFIEALKNSIAQNLKY